VQIKILNPKLQAPNKSQILNSKTIGFGILDFSNCNLFGI